MRKPCQRVARADALERRRLFASTPVELVRDLGPRTFGSLTDSGHEMVTVGSLAYFNPSFTIAPDGGRELWRTDGTADGTFQVPWEVPHESYPRDLVELNGDLRFAARGISTAGDELWKVPGAPPPPFVVGRHVYYNNSRFDGRDPAANRADDFAVATDKRPLFAGGAASVANVTSYTRGINGVMVDVSTRFDFYDDVRLSFKVGRGGDPATWAAAPAPLSEARRTDHLPLDLQRFTTTWADGAIKNAWLQATVDALFGGRVMASEVFYYGNLVGETGDEPAPPSTRVTAKDFGSTRAAVPTRGAAIDNLFDHNRDGFVNVLDTNAVRGNLFAALDAPEIPPPSVLTAASMKVRPHYRPGAFGALES